MDITFGKTHVLKMGISDAKSILLFHGGNSTAPYSLKHNMHLIKDYLIYVPNTIRHPGESDQRIFINRYTRIWKIGIRYLNFEDLKKLSVEETRVRHEIFTY